jgi:hypothetical protein
VAPRADCTIGRPDERSICGTFVREYGDRRPHGSFVEWWTTFDCDRDQIDRWEGFFANEVFQGGFDALKAHFAG